MPSPWIPDDKLFMALRSCDWTEKTDFYAVFLFLIFESIIYSCFHFEAKICTNVIKDWLSFMIKREFS